MVKHDENRGTIDVAATPREMISNVTSISSVSKKGFHPHPRAASVKQIIRQRAYELYEQRGREDGHSEEDWLHAEAEVLGTVLRRGKVA